MPRTINTRRKSSKVKQNISLPADLRDAAQAEANRSHDGVLSHYISQLVRDALNQKKTAPASSSFTLRVHLDKTSDCYRELNYLNHTDSEQEASDQCQAWHHLSQSALFVPRTVLESRARVHGWKILVVN